MKINNPAANTIGNNYHYELNDIQNKLLKCINENPGIRYRELLRSTRLSNGVLTYHLKILEEMRQINTIRQKKATRYYSIVIPIEELRIIAHLRIRIERAIIIFILEHDLCTFDEIVEYSKKAPSTISWYLRRLCEDSVISIHYGEYQLYTIIDRNLVNQILYKYNETFTDKLVNNFIDMADNL
ncbi:MAG: transcriptional regulator, ArsR family [Nitrososphaeraceae archaeon]|jgi:predicted transcriptional regulator|nr:transcriptional regulator, ArsR family [Nitrososphaeraceae archaeon]MCD6037033.1 transcriptional regulator, ArsR family [Nitrososphaeraceae archaeon]MDF2768219.1 transcriptional regulator, ArsR family [Nitrososphaeraceae archaeon]